MKLMNIFTLAFVFFCLSAEAVAQETAAAKPTPNPKPEHFAAVAILPRASARTASHVDIRLGSYSSDAETQELATLLMNNGATALRKALEKRKPIGSIRLSHRVGFYDFKVIRSRPTESARRIIAVSDRPIGFLESYYGGRTLDYNVGILVLDVKPDSKGKETGEGTLIYGASITIKNGNTVEIEHMDIQPIRLTNVRKY